MPQGIVPASPAGIEPGPLEAWNSSCSSSSSGSDVPPSPSSSEGEVTKRRQVEEEKAVARADAVAAVADSGDDEPLALRLKAADFLPGLRTSDELSVVL